MKRLLAIVIALTLVLGLAACGTAATTTAATTAATTKAATSATTAAGSSAATTAAGTTAGTTAAGTTAAGTGDILIGCLQDLSGATSVLGNMVNDGVTYAAKQINDKGGISGRKVKVITYDTKADVQEAINAFNRMVTQDKVVAVVGPPVANIGIAIAPISENYNVPVLGFFIDNRATRKDEGKGAPYKNMFLFQPSADQQGAIMAKYAVQEKSYKKFGIIFNQANSYSVSLVNAFKTTLATIGGTVAAEVPYQATDKDFKTMMNKFKEAKVDAIFAPNYTAELVLQVQHARAIGYEGPMVCGLDAAPPFISQAGPESNGVLFVNNISFEDEAVKKIVADVKAATGKEPINKFFLGSDTMNILAQIIGKVGADPAKIRDAVENLSNFQGVTGTISMNPQTHQPKGLTLFVHEIKDGKYVPIKRYAAD